MAKVRRGLSARREWLLALLLCGCGAAQTAGVDSSRQASASAVKPEDSASQPGAVAGQLPERESSSKVAPGGVAATGEHATPKEGSRLVLPASPDLVAQPIPGGQIERYQAWRQAGQTHIGKGYLYFLEVLDERRLIVKSAVEPDVRIVEFATRRELSRWPVVNLGQDDSHVVLPWRSREPSVIVGKQDGLWQYAAESGRLVTQLATQPVDRARWSDDGRVLVTAEVAIPAQTARLRFYEALEGGLRLVGELPQTERVDAWTLSRDNRYLARVFYPSDRVTVVDLHTGQTLLDAPSQRYVGSVEFSPNGRWLTLGGEGVKLFDLSDSDRRAEYTHFYNNVGDVEFSPSGDVLAVASFDGQVRLLTYDEPHHRLELLRSFSHQKNTNVYAVKFLDGGNTLISSAGDQTVRYWAAKASQPPAVAQERWQGPSQWAKWGQTEVTPAGRGKSQQRPSGAAGPTSSVDSAGQVAEQHYTPARLSGAPASSRIEPGEYECKISKLYKLRRCTVEKDAAGHTILEFDKENLLGLRGVLFDDGSVVRFDGWLTDGGSLGCANCAQQPIHAVFRGNGAAWQGLLLYRGHYDPLVPIEPPAADVVFEEAIDRFPLVLRRR